MATLSQFRKSGDEVQLSDLGQHLTSLGQIDLWMPGLGGMKLKFDLPHRKNKLSERCKLLRLASLLVSMQFSPS